MTNQPEQQPNKSFIVIQFSHPGSVLFNANMDGVTPMQLIAIGEYLSMRGKDALLQQERERAEHERQQQLSVPKPEIIIPGR